MKIKLQLFILGAGFTYSLIILRSFLSSFDARVDDQYSQLQDGNSVVLCMDSLQLTNTDIASVSSSNSIDSPQLVITTDISRVMEKLGTFVKELREENLNFIKMLLDHVLDSQFVATDPNFVMDALKQETIKGLEETAKVMVSAGFEKEFSDIYNNCRMECLQECLMHRLFRLKKLTSEDVHIMPWKGLEDEIKRWIRAFNVTLKILFPGERQLCDRVFSGFSSAADFSFIEICRSSTTQLLNFADSIATGSRSPECLFKIIEVFETLRDLIPELESLFCDKDSVSLKNEAITLWKKFGKAIRDIFMKLEYLIEQDLTTGRYLSSSLHPITQHVVNYLRVVSQSRQTLEQVFAESSLSGKILNIMDILESNLEAKAKCYEDPSLGYIFLMNNNTYILEMTKDNELGTLLGDEWYGKHTLKISHYQKTLSTMTPTLVQDFLQLLYNKQLINKIDEWNVEGSEGAKAYNGLILHEIKASLSQPPERKMEPETEIRTIVLISPPEIGHIDTMPPEDGFTWRKYGKKEIPGVKYSRSYYRCSHMKLDACLAKKKVQQLGDNPNVFEVKYYGAHSCRTSLKIPSLFLPALRISKDMTQTTMPASTSYSEWLSSGMPAKYIDSIPTAKLAAPDDGGHHPMMDSVVGFLVSAIESQASICRTSQKIKAVIGDKAFSPQTEGTMELLESILASKSGKYVDESLRHFFMMNNWRHLERTNRRMQLIEIFGDVWFQRNRIKVQQKLELYQRESWDKVLEFLKLDIINDSKEINCAIDLMKEKLRLFNMHFTETCRIQCTWSVHDEKLRGEIISSLKNILLPAYGIFIGKFQDFLKDKAYKYIEYGMFDIHDVLDNLFLRTKKYKYR
ncbi:exocyst complex component EXO70B1 [Trifolium repens]|nr:exocyst complex component EXO70B1 [Trifolium repens]